MMTTSKKVVLLIGALIALSVVITLIPNSLTQRQRPDYLSDKPACRDFDQATLLVNNTPLSVALAATDAERSRGLSGCTNLPAGQGMYFVFDELKSATFWMKGMLIPLDIIWIADGTVVGLEESVPPPADLTQADLPRYPAPQPVDAVLELSAGQAKRLGIDAGTSILLQ